jgi:hypothetical protein
VCGGRIVVVLHHFVKVYFHFIHVMASIVQGRRCVVPAGPAPPFRRAAGYDAG